MMEIISDCKPCITIEPIQETIDIPISLCPCDVVVEPAIVVAKRELIEYCLSNFLTEMVYMKNCERPQRGC